MPFLIRETKRLPAKPAGWTATEKSPEGPWRGTDNVAFSGVRQGAVVRPGRYRFTSVPATTQALIVQLERRPSERFDNKIAGTLHVYHVSLRMIGRD